TQLVELSPKQRPQATCDEIERPELTIVMQVRLVCGKVSTRGTEEPSCNGRGWGNDQETRHQGSRHFSMMPLTQGARGAAHAQRSAAPHQTRVLFLIHDCGSGPKP